MDVLVVKPDEGVSVIAGMEESELRPEGNSERPDNTTRTPPAAIVAMLNMAYWSSGSSPDRMSLSKLVARTHSIAAVAIPSENRQWCFTAAEPAVAKLGRWRRLPVYPVSKDQQLNHADGQLPQEKDAERRAE